MENVTDRTSNPFGMRPPCEEAVFGYGDANADFHLIGDHPGPHGGETSGIPFTETEAGRAISTLLFETGFASGPPEKPVLENAFCSYLHMCVAKGEPTERAYADLERYFDAELRAINAHILLPVGERATDHVLREYTTQRHRFGRELDMVALHATDLRGRGFLVVPIREPTEWTDDDAEAIRGAIAAILASDYRQTKGVATLVG
ncbi:MULTISPECIES: uracil-DNA glycosylase family protein [Saliphagus]|uniref:Uracil-DNA glycosylase family protein n=1 Tax=Saliphagus infecundisoli TaxID=1849069 RepID=A0ABD5QCX2_9EURY|nr:MULTISPECIES: uracil-DNA glycosylase family protein [Saliphagus]